MTNAYESPEEMLALLTAYSQEVRATFNLAGLIDSHCRLRAMVVEGRDERRAMVAAAVAERMENYDLEFLGGVFGEVNKLLANCLETIATNRTSG